MIDIRQLLIAAHESRQKQRQLKEANNGGTYRVGNSGCVTENGDIIGTCHRISHARFVGADSQPEFPQQIMFAVGEANEDIWISRLLESGYEGKILRHDDCLINLRWDGVNANLIGHPDIVLADTDGTPTYGLELKAVLGYTTGIKVYFENKPKDDNLIQAATYSLALGIPFALCYTSGSYIKLSFYDAKNYGVKTLLPFYKIFYTRWDNETLQYREESQATWTNTVITKNGIIDYYRLLSEMEQAKTLGPRPTDKDVEGNKTKYSKCTYCDFSKTCDDYEGDYSKWIERKG